MANNSLIPTPRVDKNGRTVIRHMKLRGTGADGSKIPQVSTHASELGYGTLLENASVALGSVYGNPKNNAVARTYMERARIHLDGYSPATLRNIANHHWGYSWGTDVNSEIDEGGYYNEGHVNDTIMLGDDLDRMGAGMYRSWVILSLPMYEGLEPYDLKREYPERRVEQAKAIASVVLHFAKSEKKATNVHGVGPDGYPVLHLKDVELQNLILNPDDPYTCQDITNIIIDHNTADASRIRELLKFETTSLQSGVL